MWSYWLYRQFFINISCFSGMAALLCRVLLQGNYSVFFFMRTKVNANFTYLYLIEINDWCLIFSSMLGHLIIYKEIQILIIMWLVKLENLKLVGFQFCRVETRIYCYTKLSIFCFVLFQHYKIMSWRTNLRKDCFLNLSKY